MPAAPIIGGWKKGTLDYTKLKTQRKYDYRPLNGKRFKRLELPSISTKAPRVTGHVMLKSPSQKSIASERAVFDGRKASAYAEPYDYNPDIKYRNNCNNQVIFDPQEALRLKRIKKEGDEKILSRLNYINYKNSLQ